MTLGDLLAWCEGKLAENPDLEREIGVELGWGDRGEDHIGYLDDPASTKVYLTDAVH